MVTWWPRLLAEMQDVKGSACFWGLAFGGESDDEYVFRERYDVGRQFLTIQSDRRILVHIVNDIFEELLNLDMEPKPESPW